jgi:hypothetical protein
MKTKLVSALVALIALVAASGALAAKPTKGATYSGKINKVSNVAFTIKFKVSSDGTHVGGFSLTDLPVYCQGGGFGQPLTRSAKITKSGTFKAKLPIYFAPTHSTEGYLNVTGKFAKGGKESGKVTTTFTHVKTCDGTSTYSTKA